MGLYQTPVKELPAGVVHACLADAFAYHGWGKLNIDLSAADQGILTVEITDSVMPGLIRESDRPVDLLMAGLLATVFTHFASAPLDCVQTDCPTRGAAASRFVVAAPERVVQIEAWIEAAPADTPISHDAIVRRLTQPPVSPAVGSNGTHEPVGAL